MSLVKQVLNELNFDDFQSLRDLFTGHPYYLDIKDHGSLFMMCFTDKSDLSSEFIRQCNGIIIEKNTFKIVHYTFEKCYENFTFECKKDSDDEKGSSDSSFSIENTISSNTKAIGIASAVVVHLNNATKAFEYLLKDNLESKVINETFNLITDTSKNLNKAITTLDEETASHKKTVDLNNKIKKVEEITGVSLKRRNSVSQLDPYYFENVSNDNSTKICISEYIDGTLIKIYYYNEKWRISTSKNINAKSNFWVSKKSFYQLACEVIQEQYNLTFEDFTKDFDPTYCYSFMIQHPENELYKSDPPTKHSIIPVNTVNLENLKESPYGDWKTISVDNLMNLKQSSNETSYIIYILNISDLESGDIEDIKRIRYISDKVTALKEIIGNLPDIGLRYIEILKANDSVSSDDEKRKQNQQTSEFKRLFKNDLALFDRIDKSIHTTGKEILDIYFAVYAKKQKIDIPARYTRTISRLHGKYKSTRIPVSKNDVFDILFSLNVRLIAYVINYTM